MLSMPKQHISLEGKRARLVSRGKSVSEGEASGMREFWFAASGFDSEFYLVAFSSVLWVVPDLTYGIAALLRSWAGELEKVACFDAYCEELPWPWRKRVLGLPLPVPRLGAFPLATLPSWQRKQAIDYASHWHPSAEPGARL